MLEAPAVGLDWSHVLKQVPGATLDGRLEGAELRDGVYSVVILQRVRGLSATDLDAVRDRLEDHYPDIRFEVVSPPGPDGVLIRTRLRVDAFASPALRFALRFNDQMKDILVHLEGDRMCIRGTPRDARMADETLARIKAFLAKQGVGAAATVRTATDCPCRDPLAA